MGMFSYIKEHVRVLKDKKTGATKKVVRVKSSTKPKKPKKK